jgi:hypothetical protein
VRNYARDIADNPDALQSVELLRADVAERIAPESILPDDHELIPLTELTLGDALQVQEQCTRVAMDLIAEVEDGDQTGHIKGRGRDGYLFDRSADLDAFAAGLHVATARRMGELIQLALDQYLHD